MNQRKLAREIDSKAPRNKNIKSGPESKSVQRSIKNVALPRFAVLGGISGLWDPTPTLAEVGPPCSL